MKLANVVAGYADGTVRMFDLNKVEMILKMQPHAAPVTAISYSSDGEMTLIYAVIVCSHRMLSLHALIICSHGLMVALYDYRYNDSFRWS